MSEPNTTRGTEETPSARLHMGIAERGKMYALAGDHSRALQYYRVAMRVAVTAKDPEIFFRHYLECVMESLEHIGAYDEVLAYCDKAIQLYADAPPPNVMATMDLASIHLRRGVVLLKRNEREQAKKSLEASQKTARGVGGEIGLVSLLLRWVSSGFVIDSARILAEQKRGGYFVVRRETVDTSRAIELSDAELGAPG